MTDQTDNASEYDILCRRLAGWEHGLANEDSELVLNSIDAIRALEAKVREGDEAVKEMVVECMREISNTAYWRAHHDNIRADRDRLAGEVERLTGGVEFWRGSHAKVTEANARLTSELAAARELIAKVLRFRRGEGEFNFHKRGLPAAELAAAVMEGWEGIEYELDAARRAGEGEK